MSKFASFNSLIVHQDQNLILINKPAGISSLDERDQKATSILAMARRYEPNAQLCHRIDKETSGILAIARNPETYRDMAMLFEKREVKKSYHAIVAGQLKVDAKPILLPLAVTREGLAKVDMKDGKPAETIITTLAMSDHFSLLECNPITGRLHQIRIHLASQHFPIVADKDYGGKMPYLSSVKRDFKQSKWENEQPMMKRFALHAYKLEFQLGEIKYECIAPYPKDFEVMLKLLDRYDHLTSSLAS